MAGRLVFTITKFVFFKDRSALLRDACNLC